MLKTSSMSSAHKLGMADDKSFEEKRLAHMSSYCAASSYWKVEGCDLSQRRLWILERFLDCQAIEDTVIDMVKNK